MRSKLWTIENNEREDEGGRDREEKERITKRVRIYSVVPRDGWFNQT